MALFFKILFLLPVLLLIQLPQAGADQFALLVGINDYPGTENDLGGCHKDVDNVHAWLLQQGFPAQNIVILKDAQGTAENMEKAFREHLVARCQPGDSAVFFYSGHGTQVPDIVEEDEDDDMDESLCAHNMHPQQTQTWITDDRLRRWIGQLRTDRVLILLDCCHSGTGTRGHREKIPGGKYMHLGFDRPERAARNFAISKAMRSTRTANNHTLLAACTSDEVARDAGPTVGGIFTSTFLREAIATGPGIPLETLMKNVSGKVSQYIAQTPRPLDSQTPQIEGKTTATLADYLSPKPGPGLAPGSAPPTSPPVAVPPTDTANAFALTLKPNKESFASGELVNISIQSAKAGFLRLYYTDARQQTYMIFPNKFQQDCQIAAETEILIPGPGAGFAFKAVFPPELLDEQGNPINPNAQEILSAVVSVEPFKDHATDQWPGKHAFIEFGNQRRGKVVSRGLDIGKNPHAIAHKIYSITPPPR